MTDIEYLKKYLDPDKLSDGIEKLNNDIPVQYIVGNVDFCGNIIEVNENVLIPRFETEELVNKAIEYLSIFDNPHIVDIGTGSGCIAITLKKKINCVVDAVDISKEALNIAKNNALRNDVKINFYLGNILDKSNKKYDCIISNPPYIGKDEEIMGIVKNNEPHIALYADNNGLYYYEEILSKCKNYLKDKYLIAFEIGYNQSEEIKQLALKYLGNCEIKIEKDMQGKDRFCFIKN